MPAEPATRRARLRAQTETEIKEAALTALSSDGSVEAVTLSAIARNLGMSIAGLYRYFASRDDLLVALTADAYSDFADELERAVEAAHAATPAERLDAVASAYRAWALAHPGRYRLMFASSWGSGTISPDVTMPNADRAMLAIVSALNGAPLVVLDDVLEQQLSTWAERASLATVPPGRLVLAVTTWTRLHGVVSLEIEGVWGAMGLDAGLLVDREMQLLVPSRRKR